MNRLKTAGIIGVTLVLVGACWFRTATVTAAPAEPPLQSVNFTDLGTRVPIIGQFGLPIGQYLTLEGRRVGHARFASMIGPGDFQVDKINGKTMDKPMILWVNGVVSLPEGTPCRITGYETGSAHV